MITMTLNLNSFDQHVFFNQDNKESQWMFLEKTFITDIRNDSQSIWGSISTIIPAFCALSAGYNFLRSKSLPSVTLSENDFQNWYYAPTKNFNKVDASTKAKDKVEKIIESMLNLENLCLIGGISSAIIIGTNLLQSTIEHQINRTAVEEFFANWELNSNYTPTELHEGFSIIAESINSDDRESILENADEIVATLNFLIIRHFEKRYNKFFEAESCSTLNYEKSTSDIIKNIVGTAKDLTA